MKNTMKKLMIAVAAAAMVGAASAACKPGETPKQYDATVYSVKISLKTPKGELCGGKTGSASTCAPGTKGVDGYVRTPSTYALQGYFANCSESCDILKKFTQNDIALWNTREKLFLVDPVYNVDFIHVLSKSQKNAEIKFSLAGTMNNAKRDASFVRKFDLVAAGFGKYSPSADIYTSFSGNVVGTVSKVYYPKAVNTGTEAAPKWICPDAGYWICTTDNVCGNEVKVDPSVAYGTFAIKYNASASKKMAAGTMPSIPSYVTTPTGWKK